MEEHKSTEQPQHRHSPSLINSIKRLQDALNVTETSNSKLRQSLQADHVSADDNPRSEMDELLAQNITTVLHLECVLEGFSRKIDYLSNVIDTIDVSEIPYLTGKRTKLSELLSTGSSNSSGYISKQESQSDDFVDGDESGLDVSINAMKLNHKNNGRKLFCKSTAVQTELDTNGNCETDSFKTNAINYSLHDKACSTVSSYSDLSVVSSEDYRLICETNTELQTEVRTSRLFFESLIERLKNYHKEAQNKLNTLELGFKDRRTSNPTVVYSDCSSQSSEYPFARNNYNVRKANSVGNFHPSHQRSLSSMSSESMSLLRGESFERKKLELLNRNKVLKTEIEELRSSPSSKESRSSSLSVPSSVFGCSSPEPTTQTTPSQQAALLEQIVAKHVEDYLRMRQSPTPTSTTSSSVAVSGRSISGRRRKANSNGPNPFRTINVTSWNRRESR